MSEDGLVDGPREAGESDETRELPAGDTDTLEQGATDFTGFVFTGWYTGFETASIATRIPGFNFTV